MIAHVDNRITYNGNGNATEFAYQFKILDRTDIKVMLVKPDGSTQILSKDYYVDVEKKVVIYPGYAPGAEIPESERPPVLPAGWRLVLYREVPITQLVRLPEIWPFNVIEAMADKLTIICQQLKDKLSRALTINESSASNIDTTVPWVPGKTFRVSDDGTHLQATEDPGKVIDEAKGLAEETATNAQEAKQAAAEIKTIYNSGGLTPITDLAGSIGTAIKRWGYIFANKVFAMNLPIVYKSVAEMKADSLLFAGMTACTLGYYSPNDGGAGTYIIRAKQEADVDDGGSLHELANGNVAELVVENGTVCPEQFGAKGDGVTDDSAVIEKIINFNNVRFVNSYLISKTIVIDGTNKPSVQQTKNIMFEKNLIYTGNDCAILVKGKYVHLEIKGVLKSSGAGIRLLGEGYQCANCNITFHNIISDGNGIELISNIDGCFNHVITGQGIYYGDRYHTIATSEVCGIYCQTKNNSSFVTESRFDIKFIGNFNKAIFMNGAIGENIQNIFLNFISLEHNTYGIYAYNANYIANHVRIGEYEDNGRAITCIGVCKADIYLNTHFPLSAINVKQLTGGKVKLHVQDFSFTNKGSQSIANLVQSVVLNGKPPCLTPKISANYRLNVNGNYAIGKDVVGYFRVDNIPQTFSVAKKTVKVILPYDIYNYCGMSEIFIEFDNIEYSIEFLDEELNSLASITSTYAGEVKKMIFTLVASSNKQKVIVY